MNATAQFLAKKLRPAPGAKESDLSSYLKGVVSNKIPISAAGSMVEEHLQEFYARMVKRDALRHELAEKGNVENSKIALYLMRSAWNDIRNGGKNPVMRELYLFRTESEKTSPPPAMVEPDLLVIERSSGLEIVKHQLDTLSAKDLWERIEKACSRFEISNVLVKLLKMKAEGFSLSEISDALSIPLKDVSKHLLSVKDLLYDLLTEDRKKPSSSWRVVKIGRQKVLRFVESPAWRHTCSVCDISVSGETEIESIFGFLQIRSPKGFLVKEIPNKECKECRCA